MNYETAKRQLLLHGPGTDDGPDQEVSLPDGFLGSLRPYQGLQEKNFHQVLEALFSVAPTIQASPLVERDLVHAVWDICSTARNYGLRPNGLLQRNKLITAADITRLDQWLEIIEVSALRILRGVPTHSVVTKYAEYLGQHTWGENIDFFIPLIIQAVADPELSDSLEINLAALQKLGRKAADALPVLRAVEQLAYTWYEPVDRCTAEMRSVIQSAIAAIESDKAENGN